jgi:Dynein heavy chain C-terminal domain
VLSPPLICITLKTNCIICFSFSFCLIQCPTTPLAGVQYKTHVLLSIESALLCGTIPAVWITQYNSDNDTKHLPLLQWIAHLHSRVKQLSGWYMNMHSPQTISVGALRCPRAFFITMAQVHTYLHTNYCQYFCTSSFLQLIQDKYAACWC